MSTAQTNSKSVAQTPSTEEELKNVNEITSAVIEYLTEFARENPGYAALGCLGVGFVLGWKLKPW